MLWAVSWSTPRSTSPNRTAAQHPTSTDVCTTSRRTGTASAPTTTSSTNAVSTRSIQRCGNGLPTSIPVGVSTSVVVSQ